MSDVISSSQPLISVENSIQTALQEVLNNKAIGFTSLPLRHELFKKSQEVAHQLISEYTQIVLIGIGGSSMGAHALHEISGQSQLTLHFLENVDAESFKNLWNKISTTKENLKKTAFLIVSKSGSTIEILWNYSTLENLLAKHDINLIDQSFFISDLGSNPISDLARQHQRPLLEVPSDVGGRFSVLSPVGLVIAAICGFNLEQMRKGAETAVKNTSVVTQATQMFLNSFKRKEDITLFWFYNSNFRWFGGWIQQLWAESLGKKNTKSGTPAPNFSTPMTAIGACDQHSILQQVAHGPKNKFVCFYSFNSSVESELKFSSTNFQDLKFLEGCNYGDLIKYQALATAEALSKNSVSTAIFNIDNSDKSYSLGFLFMYFQLVVATLGQHENIDAFDQPGVTLGKELTLNLLKQK
jgi:glucose-6-phosphate isomerase